MARRGFASPIVTTSEAPPPVSAGLLSKLLYAVGLPHPVIGIVREYEPPAHTLLRIGGALQRYVATAVPPGPPVDSPWRAAQVLERDIRVAKQNAANRVVLHAAQQHPEWVQPNDAPLLAAAAASTTAAAAATVPAPAPAASSASGPAGGTFLAELHARAAQLYRELPQATPAVWEMRRHYEYRPPVPPRTATAAVAPADHKAVVVAAATVAPVGATPTATAPIAAALVATAAPVGVAAPVAAAPVVTAPSASALVRVPIVKWHASSAPTGLTADNGDGDDAPPPASLHLPDAVVGAGAALVDGRYLFVVGCRPAALPTAAAPELAVSRDSLIDLFASGAVPGTKRSVYTTAGGAQSVANFSAPAVVATAATTGAVSAAAVDAMYMYVLDLLDLRSGWQTLTPPPPALLPAAGDSLSCSTCPPVVIDRELFVFRSGSGVSGVYHLDTQHWTALPEVGSTRLCPGGCFARIPGTTRVLFTGGYDASAAAGEQHSAVHVFDAATRAFLDATTSSGLPPPLPARVLFASAVGWNDGVVIAGGLSPSADSASRALTEALVVPLRDDDLLTAVPLTTASVTSPHGERVALRGNGQRTVVLRSTTEDVAQRTVWFWEPPRRSWIQLRPMRVARWLHALATPSATAARSVFAIGGAAGEASCEQYHPKNDEWLMLPDMGRGCYAAATAFVYL